MKEKEEDNIEEKKMRKEEMENDNVLMCHSLQKKQRENRGEIEEIEERKMSKEVMENNNVVTCHSLRRNKRKTQKKLVLLHLYTIHMKWMTIMPEDIQIASPYM